VSLLGWLFNLLYHPLAWSYDWVAALVSCGQWQRWVNCALPYLPGPRILEIGYGPGHLQKALAQENLPTSPNSLQIFGLDASRQMSRLAARRLRRSGLPVRLTIGYAKMACFPSEIFEQVVVTFPSNYILDPACLVEIRRLLVPGGRLVVIPAAWVTGDTPCQKLLAGLLRRIGQGRPLHSEIWTEPFRQAGFQIESLFINLPDSQVWLILADKPGEL
jgi:ubiquinone/menaquinone biosynthesis C-methylase UbiE